MNIRRTIKLQLLLNELESNALEWLAARDARTEGELLREMIREAADQAGYLASLEARAVEREELAVK